MRGRVQGFYFRSQFINRVGLGLNIFQNGELLENLKLGRKSRSFLA